MDRVVKAGPAADSANLDVLRAMAVLYVVVGHTLGAFPSLHFPQRPWLGRLGVLFFFVHTCLVLMRSLERTSNKLSGKDLFLNFYVRRAFRIYPLSVLFVAVVVAFDIRVLRGIAGWEDYALTKLDVVSNFLLTQNLTFSPPVMGVLWSLPIEVQMYLFLPPLFLLVSRLPNVWVLLGLWALSIPVALVQPRFIARASLAQYVPDFLPGVIAYVLTRRSQPWISHRLWIPTLLGLSAVFMAFPSWELGWPVCLALGLLIPCFHDVPEGWLQRSGAAVAKYSYGLYLWHTPAILLAFETFPTVPFAVQLIFFIVCLAAVPVALFHWVENPMIKHGTRLANKLVSSTRVPGQMVRAAAGERS